jgi:hypothetical protein
MNKKIIRIAVIMLLIVLLIPIESTLGKSDVKINLYAGTKLRNIGTGIGFKIYNNGDEPVTVTLICNMYYHKNSKSIRLNITVNPNECEIGNFGVLNGIKRISASAQVNDYTLVRKGFSISQLVIFTK